MPTGRFQISAYEEGPRPDFYTNTVYLDIQQVDPTGSVNWQQLCSDLATAWISATSTIQAGVNRIRVRAYDLADAEPRLPKGDSIKTTSLLALGGPTEVALCLSFRGPEKRPRQRGRIFVGPFTGVVGARPTTTQRSTVLSIAQALADLGGVNVDWVVFSPTATAEAGGDVKTYSVQEAWVDDEWDTVRSRGRAATTRSTLALSE